MSFSFAAIGKRDEVIAQVRSHKLHDSGSLAQEVRELAVRELEAERPMTHANYDYAYIVKASGHSGGGSPLSLSLTIEAQWVPEAVTEVVISHDQEAASGT